MGKTLIFFILWPKYQLESRVLLVAKLAALCYNKEALPPVRRRGNLDEKVETVWATI